MTRRASTFAALAGLLVLAGACADGARPVDTAVLTTPRDTLQTEPLDTLAGLIVSQPVSASGSATASAGALRASAAVGSTPVGSTVVYVSLVPGTVPAGLEATIRNPANAQVVTTPVVAGGFDPVAIGAAVGDTLLVEITRSGGAAPLWARETVRAPHPPVVVRTSPPSGGRDVPLNAIVVLVFDEPLDSATADTAAVQLWQGTTRVAGTVRFADAAHLRAEFHPDSLLAPQTHYQAVLTTGIRDVSGLALDSTVTVPFTTGTTAPAANLVFASVSAGNWHVCGVTTGGSAYCWGDNSRGQLGTGDTASSTTPVPVAGGLTFKAVSSGLDVTCGITTAGALYCWGEPGGLFPPYGVDYGFGFTLVPVRVFAGLTFAAVSMGGDNGCGVTSDGTAYCWGNAGLGSLGNGTVYGHPAPAPARVAGGLKFAAVSPGGSTTCGVTTGGAAYCWGSNAFSGLGTGAEAGPGYCFADSLGSPIDPCSTVPVPVAGGLTFTHVSDMNSATCGLTTSGAAYCWGSNLNDGRGFGTNTGPEQCLGINGNVAGTRDDSLADACSRLPRAVPGAPALVSLSGYDNYTCGLTSAGAAYCWGHPQELGDLSSSTAPVAVPGGLTFATLSAGQDATCGVTTTGVAYCWGQNYAGQLGDGTTTFSTVPVKVAGQP
jgi:alpha-tubulin suppressor-like RCC1 family protein